MKDAGDNSIPGEDTVAVDPVTSNDGEQRRAKNAEASVPKKVKEENVSIKSILLKKGDLWCCGGLGWLSS